MTLFYNGIQYEVETEGDIEPINLVAEDENEDSMQIADNSKDFQESYWTPKVMHLFLDECIKRKMLIRDPRIQRHKVFLAIHKQMKSNGHIFKVITLERKLRTMKKHFEVVSENNKNPSSKRICWQYYDKMKILYPDCLSDESREETQPFEIDVQKRPLSLPSRTTSIFEKPKPKSLNHTLSSSQIEHASEESSITQLMLRDNCSSALLGLTFGRKDKQEKEHNTNNVGNLANNEKLRMKILSLEERRTIATEKILTELRQSNKLKEEMLDLNIKLFEVKKQMEEY